MENKSEEEDFVESSQPILKNRMKTCKERKSPRKLVRNSEKLVITPKNENDLKRQVQSKLVTNYTPEKSVSDNIIIGAGSNFNTPSKINLEFLDSSHLGDFEVLNMQHDMDDILDWRCMQFENDSTVDYTCPDVILRVLDSEKSLETDPLFIENESGNKTEVEKMSQSPLRKSVNKSSPQKSNRKGRSSFAKKVPKAQYKQKKSVSSDEEMEMDVNSIWEEVRHIEKKENKCSPQKSNRKGRSSLAKKVPKAQYIQKKSVSSDEEMEMDVDSIWEEVQHIEKKEKLSSKTIEKLQNLEVHLKHKVPAQHKVETSTGSHGPTQQQKRIFEKLHPIVRGKFSEKEDNIIKRNWKSFCKIHNWDENNTQPFLYMRYQGKYYISSLTERQKFVQFLSNGLPSRTLYSVYNRFRSLFGKKFHQTKGRFSEEEDRKLELYMKGAPDSDRKFTELAKILGRTPKSVWSRYEILKKKSAAKRKKAGKPLNRKEVTWTVALIEEFIQQLMDATLSEDVMELKYAIIPKVVWKEMESRMHIKHEHLKIFWLQRLHIQLFAPNPIYLNDVKIKLIEILYKSKISHPKEINWSDICSNFDGFTTALLYRLFHVIMIHVSRKRVSRNFGEILKYLHKKMIPYLKETKDKILPRIVFEDETVRIMDDEGIRNVDDECKEEDVTKRKSERLNSLSENKIEHKDNSDITWTLPMREKFLKTLLVVTFCKHDVDELKDAIIPKVVWEEMADIMKVNENRLIELWYKEMHMQLYSPIPVYMNDVKIKLIELIYKEKIKELNLIKWPKLCRYFDGMTTFFICDVFCNLVRSAQREIDSDNFCDIIEYLHKTMIFKLKNQPTDKYLPRVSFKNGKLSILVEDFQKNVISKEVRRSSSFNTSNTDSKDDAHIIWTLPMLEKFIKKLLVVTLSIDLHELKDAIIPKVVWDEVEKKMKVDQKVLKELWYYELHMQLFCPDQIFMNDIKIKLIEYFYRENITELREIFWPKVCTYFDGFTTFFLSKIFYDLIRSAAEEIGSTVFSDILKYLHEEKIQSLKYKSTDATLPRLAYERGFISIINENIKEEN